MSRGLGAMQRHILAVLARVPPGYLPWAHDVDARYLPEHPAPGLVAVWAVPALQSRVLLERLDFARRRPPLRRRARHPVLTSFSRALHTLVARGVLQPVLPHGRRDEAPRLRLASATGQIDYVVKCYAMPMTLRNT